MFMTYVYEKRGRLHHILSEKALVNPNGIYAKASPRPIYDNHT